jgi:NYN domain-containing protein/OST-HTH/LOTUS domain-containing protein
MPSPNTDKLAVLIDADNAQASIIGAVLTEVARYGTATIKRAYGDWTTPHLNSWKEIFHNLAIQPIQQFRYTIGKNATDSALIIDAMDLLHGGKVDGFCLVSSDSDFTRLATRVREAGLSVYGFGEKKTPRAFVSACDKFIYTEILRAPVAKHAAVEAPQEPLKPLLTAAVAGAAKEDGWAPLSNVGLLVLKSHPSFDPRNYGCEKLSELVRLQTYLKVKKVPVAGSPNAQIFVRIKAT